MRFQPPDPISDHMPQDEPNSSTPQANPGYAAFQIARALKTSEQNGDAATRERARAKAEKWMGVLEGLLSGLLSVGSRQPMMDAPVWATPEVVTGGFVTGELLAGGPIRPHEKEIAIRIGAGAVDAERQRINAWFLSDAGFSELAERLNSGCYEIEVPEEAALLVAAWLAQNDAADEARELVEVIAPHFARLRFYPKPAKHSLPQGARIFLESVRTVLDHLRSIRPNPRTARGDSDLDTALRADDRAFSRNSRRRCARHPAGLRRAMDVSGDATIPCHRRLALPELRSGLASTGAHRGGRN